MGKEINITEQTMLKKKKLMFELEEICNNFLNENGNLDINGVKIYFHPQVSAGVSIYIDTRKAHHSLLDGEIEKIYENEK